jgi:aspartate/methionine/tyrosine aminotransferase
MLMKNSETILEGVQQNIHASPFIELNDIGVIAVLSDAAKLGYYNGHPDWANLGQGEPEVGELPEGAPRINSFAIEPDDDRYGPVNGTIELRNAIAKHYNRLYRKDKISKYTANNVSVAMGGRLALSRIFAILGNVRLGFKIPEYPAYEDMLNAHDDKITPVCIPSKPENNHSIPPENFSEAIQNFAIDAFLFSNPCNPTGHVIQGEALAAYVKIANAQNCPLIIDEVYSHFIYENGKPAANPVSSAAYIEDVSKDPVLIVDGLTKSFRYPGWRLAWVIGPEKIIENLGRASSSIDGGPSVPIQRAAIQLFEPKRVSRESKALRKVFSRKQNLTLQALRDCGMICSEDANSTFYVWADISCLPYSICDSDNFFREALLRKVITVPGYMFDIRPDKDKSDPAFRNHVRFSFGPDEKNLIMGLERIAEMIQSHKMN